ncbi:hypothetical protein ACP90_21880 [Labrenzia sp. CP4]|jgi:hypothetical protein|uniref:hypothetical protein n=1 Tax=Labrenzia sp. CP4 TaxID=1674922 RepID=UPI0007822FB3|nr:hypothetical protein [Labrenzia sp. CP4]AMN54607.1 hypothetical protein ACP90_21880 [Labrenzia sp. CP4]
MRDKDISHSLNEDLAAKPNSAGQSQLRELFHRWRTQEEKLRNLHDDCDDAVRETISEEIELLQQQAADFEPCTMEDLTFKIIFADDNGDMDRNTHQEALATRAYAMAGINPATGQEIQKTATEVNTISNSFGKAADFASVKINLKEADPSDRYHLYETLSAICDILAANLCQPSHSMEAGVNPNAAGNVVDSLIECLWHINDEIVASIEARTPASYSEFENRAEFLLKVYAQYGISAAEMASRAANFASQELLLLRQQQASKNLAA